MGKPDRKTQSDRNKLQILYPFPKYSDKSFNYVSDNKIESAVTNNIIIDTL